MGPSAALCENIGHTYSSLGDLDKVVLLSINFLLLSDSMYCAGIQLL